MITLTPAYGRDYRAKAAVLADFDGNKDFIINSFGHPSDGKPVNKGQLKAEGIGVVNIRYSGNRRVFPVQL